MLSIISYVASRLRAFIITSGSVFCYANHSLSAGLLIPSIHAGARKTAEDEATVDGVCCCAYRTATRFDISEHCHL